MDTLYISEDNHASFTAPQGDIYNAISGNPMLMVAGETVEFGDHPYLQTRHPRTAVGLTEDGNTLILVVVDGRQPNYSEGITLPELSQIFLENGAYSAMNLDGGGSSTLIIEDENGNPTMLNSSIHSRIVARERPVANQLGVYAKPLH